MPSKLETKPISVVLSAIVFVIVANVINTIGAVLTISYYMNPAYFPLWSKLMMSKAGPPGPEFFAISILFSLITGLVFSWAYSLFRGSVPGEGLKKGINFGLILFLVAGVPFTLTTYLILAVPAMLLFSWAIESLLVYVIWGAAVTKVIR